jgi:cytosine/adenosine deaminase-related metal-dependent hydrolase
MRLLIEAANGSVAVENGIIVEPSGKFDGVVHAPGEVRPGLINAHDHLHRNHYGRLGVPPYANAHDWAADIQVRCAAEIAQGRNVERRIALLTGAWKNLLAGVTHVVHHDPWERDFDSGFPIRVVRIANADCVVRLPECSFPAGVPVALHVAEGVDEIAAEEVRTLHACGVLNRHLMAVHGVGADTDGVAKLRDAGCAVVWCPTSNHFLFGRSAPLDLLEGTDVLLGSDSLLTGAGTLLDEIQAVRGMISDARLLDAVGSLAADRLGIAAPSLAPGSPADIVLFRRDILDATAEDVLLVIVAGEPRVLAPEHLSSLPTRGGRIITWRGVTRWISEETAILL